MSYQSAANADKQLGNYWGSNANKPNFDASTEAQMETIVMHIENKIEPRQFGFCLCSSKKSKTNLIHNTQPCLPAMWI